MIRATMYWDRLRMETEGHAGYAEEGQDIVCAGASMLMYALGRVMEESEARGRCECKTKITDGKMIVWSNPTMGAINEIKAYFRMAVTGFRMLQEEYPGKVTIREVQ